MGATVGCFPICFVFASSLCPWSLYTLPKGHLLCLRGQVRAVGRVKLAKQDHRSYIYCKPPKEKIGPVQTVFTMSIFALGLLLPAGWIMHHIPVYRQRPPSQVCPNGPPT